VLVAYHQDHLLIGIIPSKPGFVTTPGFFFSEHAMVSKWRVPPTPKEETMLKAYLKSALAGAFLLGTATAALAVTGEFGNMCTMGLATGKDIQTDCSINSQLQGKTYCFGSKEAMAEFMKNPTANLAKAQDYYSKKHPG
jgi:YHS domain-containing protein